MYIFMQEIGCQDVVLFALPNAFITNNIKAKQRCRDGVMSDFVSLGRHLLVPFFFMFLYKVQRKNVRAIPSQWLAHAQIILLRLKNS